jgi:hypothetical protein
LLRLAAACITLAAGPDDRPGLQLDRVTRRDLEHMLAAGVR